MVSNAGFEKPARRSASSASKATSASARPGRTAARAATAAVESIRPACRITSISPSSLMILAASTTRSVLTKRAGMSAWSRANLSRVITAPSTPTTGAFVRDHSAAMPPLSCSARARRGGGAARQTRPRAPWRSDVTAVDDEAAVGGGHQDGTQAAFESAQVSQVRRVRKDEGIDAQTRQGLPHGVEAREIWRFGSSGRGQHYSNGQRGVTNNVT